MISDFLCKIHEKKNKQFALLQHKKQSCQPQKYAVNTKNSCYNTKKMVSTSKMGKLRIRKHRRRQVDAGRPAVS